MQLPKKILVIRLSSIGDILLTTPVYRLIKKMSPKTELHVITKREFGELLAYSPHIDKLLLFDSSQEKGELKKWKARIKAEKYDFIADLHNNFRSHVLTADYPPAKVRRLKKYKKERFILIHFGRNLYNIVRSVAQRYIDVFHAWEMIDDGQGAEIFWPDSVVKKMDELFPELYNFTGIAPGAAFHTKTWPLECFAQLAEKLYKNNQNPVVFFGGPEEAEIESFLKSELKIPYINLIGKLSLLESTYMISRASLLITNDSSPMHMAGAVQTPVIAIMGSSVKELGFYPYRNRHKVLEVHGLSCRPCSHIGRHKCPKKHFDCMLKIEPDVVFEASLQLLKEIKNS